MACRRIMVSKSRLPALAVRAFGATDHDCRFAKAASTCSDPDRLDCCAVPSLPSRNGRLAQAAVSLFLFFRDACGGDFVGGLDARLAAAERPGDPCQPRMMREAVLGPMIEVFGVSAKVISMAMADLLLAGDPGRERWVVAGGSMIAIDSLVHNWLHRTGILHACEAEHAYGDACYGQRGCANTIEVMSDQTDARAFNPAFPRCFPRFIQHAIWSICAANS
jgi:hypothetical protein